MRLSFADPLIILILKIGGGDWIGERQGDAPSSSRGDRALVAGVGLRGLATRPLLHNRVSGDPSGL
jgi:hypothetical protein